jgi:hypothetical protein
MAVTLQSIYHSSMNHAIRHQYCCEAARSSDGFRALKTLVDEDSFRYRKIDATANRKIFYQAGYES